VFSDLAVKGIKANEEKCREYVKNRFGIITALNPHLGYETAAQIVKEAMQAGKSIQEICLERHYLTKEELQEILDPYEMTTPGIAGSHMLDRM
jgi:aspartate ammonia-lyase